METKTIWTVSQAYQDATCGNDGEIHSYVEVFKTKTSAINRLREWMREQIEQHYEGNEDWTEKDTDAEVSEVLNHGNGLCSTLHYKWVNDYEHLAWCLKCHNV